jgi:TonB family protein
MIAYAMLYSVAVGVPMLLGAAAIASVLRRHGKPERGIWLGGLTLAVGLPVLGLLQSLWSPSVTSSLPIPEPTGVIGLPAVVALPPGPAALGLSEILLGAWLLGSALLALRWMMGALRLAKAGRSWHRTTLDGVPVWMTDRLGPAVAGVVRPRVLVPPWLVSMPPQRRSLVLLHEQEHIRAGDPWLMVLSRLAPVLAPWNPVIWVLASRVRRAIELDCDRRVLRQRPDVRAYGTTLIEVSSRDSGRLVALAAFAETEAPLRNRILTMTTPSRTVSVLALLTSMVLGVVLLVAAFEIPIPTVRAEFEFGPAAADDSGPEPVSSGAAVADPPDPVGGRVQEPQEPAAEAEPASPAEAARPPIEEPTSVESVIEELRVEAAARPRRPATAAVLRPVDDELPSTVPTFTPFTVAPRLINLAEVQRVLMQEYPKVLRDAGIGGRVTIWFYIDRDGRVAATRINESSGHQALDQAAMNVADVYRFSSALNRDERVPVWVSLPITFQVR